MKNTMAPFTGSPMILYNLIWIQFNDDIRFDNIIYQNLFMIWTFLDVKDIATQFRYYMRYRLHANVSLSFFHAMIPVIVCIISHIPTQQQPTNIKEKNKHIDISIYKHIKIPMLYSHNAYHIYRHKIPLSLQYASFEDNWYQNKDLLYS